MAAVIVNRAPSHELDWDLRQKSRFDATTSEGRKVGVFLPRGTVIRGGDVLITTAGTFIRVIAAPQAVLRITACTAHHHGHSHDHGAFDLMRAAYDPVLPAMAQDASHALRLFARTGRLQ